MGEEVIGCFLELYNDTGLRICGTMAPWDMRDKVINHQRPAILVFKEKKGVVVC